MTNNRRGIRALLAVTDWASYAVLVTMALVVCLDIGCRYLLGRSIQIAEEVSSLGLVSLIFLSLAGAFQDGHFLRVDALYGRLPASVKRAVEPIFLAIGIAVTSIYIYFLARLVQNSFVKTIRSDTVLGTPNYLPQTVMVIGLAALLIVLAASFIRACRTLILRGQPGD